MSQNTNNCLCSTLLSIAPLTFSIPKAAFLTCAYIYQTENIHEFYEEKKRNGESSNGLDEDIDFLDNMLIASCVIEFVMLIITSIHFYSSVCGGNSQIVPAIFKVGFDVFTMAIFIPVSINKVMGGTVILLDLLVSNVSTLLAWALFYVFSSCRV